MPGETRQLAQFVEGFSIGDMPSGVRARAIQLIIDQIGNQIGGSELPWSQQIRDTYAHPGGTAEATVMGSGERLPLAAAAFVNGAFGHAFEYDDANPTAHGHPGTELLPPLLAAGEREGLSGAEFLAGFVAAYELRGRVGWAVSPDLLEFGGPQYSTSCGPFGAAAAAARALGLGADGIEHAIAIAGTFSGGLMQYNHGGGSAKRIFPAVAASAGIQSALLAQAGMTGPAEILEGKRGLLRIFPRSYRPERLVEGLGSLWLIEQALFKPYSCCAGIHAPIDGLRKILERQSLTADRIDRVVVGLPKGFVNHATVTDPKDVLGLQFSTSFSLGMTILKGRNGPGEYTEASLVDPDLRAFAAKVSIEEDPSQDPLFEQGLFSARVRVTTSSGDQSEEFVRHATGSPGAPFTTADVDQKFRSQVTDRLGTAQCEALLEALHGIDTAESLHHMISLATRR